MGDLNKMGTVKLSSFSLDDSDGKSFEFPADGRSIICFVKEDCPTCREVMPVIDSMAVAMASQIDFFILGQTLEGNKILEEEFSPSFSILDDSQLKVSFSADVETVPTLFIADSQGKIESSVEGFVKEEWRNLVRELIADNGLIEPDVDWEALPDWRPGCGSLSVDPIHAEKLRAEAEDSPIRARKIAIGSMDDEFEFMFDQGFSDGLPVIPPTPERVLRMLSGTKRDSQDVIAQMPPNMGEVTVEKVAINCVLAGCKPEYMPIVMAAVEAVVNDDFNIHGVMATTMGASPVLVVNGPIRDRVGMNSGIGALGQGNRANATIGRALRLIIRNIGGAKPGGTERSTLGNPMKFTMCFAEWEEESNWEPLHVERGFQKGDSVVTAFAMHGGPVLTADEMSLTGEPLAGSIALATQNILSEKAYGVTDCLLVVSPEHAMTFSRDDYQKSDIRRKIQEVTKRKRSELAVSGPSGVGMKPEIMERIPKELLQEEVSKFADENNIHIVVAGAKAGKFTARFDGWLTGPRGSKPVSRKIEEV